MSEKLVVSFDRNDKPNVMEKFEEAVEHHDEPSSGRKVPKRFFFYVLLVTVLVSLSIGAGTSSGVSYFFYNRGDKHYRDKITEGVNVDSWYEWAKWSSCSVSCGTGMRTRDRRCNGTHCEGGHQEISLCVKPTCVDSCHDLSDWAQCSVSCGSGMHSWHEWGDWSPCSVSCGSGMRDRYRRCNGTNCEGGHQEVDLCTNPICLDSWHEWGDWSPCSVSCGSGMRDRYRRCNGTNCEGGHQEVDLCTNPICLGNWYSWEAWSQCSTSCGRGIRFRIRACESDFCGYGHSQNGRCNGVCNSHSWNNEPNLITIIVSVAMSLLVIAHSLT